MTRDRTRDWQVAARCWKVTPPSVAISVVVFLSTDDSRVLDWLDWGVMGRGSCQVRKTVFEAWAPRDFGD